MNTKSIIEIFRGDDSDALGYQTIVGTIHTDLDLTGCKAVFRYLGFFQEFDPIPEDGKLTMVIPSASSMQFPPGFGYASLKVYDIDRKVRTFTNRIPVFVKTMTPCRGGGEFDVEFSPFPELAPLKIFKGPNADDFDLYTGFISKIIDRASAQKYGLSMLFDAMDAEKTAEGGCAASPAAVKAAYDAVIGVLTDNYYTKTQTDEAIDKLAAYYITSDTQGNPFATHAALVNATTYYSGGSIRTPTRNDYAIVIADETHNNEEWRYIYSENEQGVGQWEPQYAVEGVITFDDTVTHTSANGVKSSGIWSAIWGALSALPTGFSSLYDWCVAQLAGKASKADATLTQHYTDWVCEPAETQGEYPTSYFVAWGTIPSTEIETWCLYIGIPGDADYVDHVDERTPDLPNITSATFEGVDGETVTATRTASGYILGPEDPAKPNYDKPLASEEEAEALRDGVAEANAQTEVIESKPNNPHLLADAFPITFTLNDTDYTVSDGDSRLSFGGSSEFTMFVDGYGVCDFKSDNTFRNAWLQAENLKFNGRDPVEGVWPVLHFAVSDVKVRDVSVLMKSAVVSPSTSATTGHAADAKSTGDALALKANASDLNAKLDSTSAAPAFSSDSSTQYPVGSHCTYNGKLYKCTTATTGGMWVAGSWTMDTMTDSDAVLDITAQNQLRVVAKDGTLLWAQGYDLASTSSATLACDATNNFTFADGATTQAFTLPTAPTGKVGDFGLDIDNSANTGAATMTLTGLDSTFSVVVPEGESLNDMLAIAAGELARFYITLSTFRVNNLPTWHIVKQIVENGGAQS